MHSGAVGGLRKKVISEKRAKHLNQRKLEWKKVNELIEDVTGGYTRLSDITLNNGSYELNRLFARASQIRRAIVKARLVGKGEKGKMESLLKLDLMQITTCWKLYTGTA